MALTRARKEQLVVILSALGVVLASVLTTLYFAGLDKRGDTNQGYRNVTFTDAVLTCRETIESGYGRQIASLVIDDHSSRYDDRQFVYKLFFDMDLRAGANQPLSRNYVNCFVRAANGRVDTLEVLEETDDPSGRPDDGKTNLFGFPR